MFTSTTQTLFRLPEELYLNAVVKRVRSNAI